MGGAPSDRPERYQQGSPQSLLPLGVPQFLISATVLTADKAREYQKIARAKGDRVDVLTLDTGHFNLISPGDKAWEQVKRMILDQAFQTKGEPTHR